MIKFIPAPLATTCTLVICTVSTAIVLLWDGIDIGDVCLAPESAAHGDDAYRLWLSGFVHGNALHLLLNASALAALGRQLEPLWGTLRFAWMVVVLLTLTNGAIVLGALVSAALLPTLAWPFRVCAVGFSGVLFALVAIEVYANADAPGATRSLFGVRVPAWAFPWVLVALMQLLIPNACLVCHVSGVLIGALEAHGWFEWLVPRGSFFRALEDSRLLRLVVQLPSFLPYADGVLSYDLAPDSPQEQRSSTTSPATWHPSRVWHAVAAVGGFFGGRGHVLGGASEGAAGNIV